MVLVWCNKTVVTKLYFKKSTTKFRFFLRES